MNTNILNRSLLGSLLLTVPALLLADTSDKGWSVEVKAFESEAAGTISAFTLDDDRSGASLGIGYAFNKYVAVQAAYSDHGRHYATDCPPPLVCLVQNEDQIDLKALAVALTTTWPVTRIIEVYGKVGLTAWDADFARFARDDSDGDLVYGVGIGAKFSPQWRISLQYEKVDDLELETLGLGLAYRF